MKINEPGVRLPFGKHAMHAFVVERLFQFQPALQVVASAHIIAGIYVQPAQGARNNTYSAVQRPTPRSSSNRSTAASLPRFDNISEFNCPSKKVRDSSIR